MKRNFFKYIFISVISISTAFGVYSIASESAKRQNNSTVISKPEHTIGLTDLSGYRFHCDEDTSEIESMLSKLAPLNNRPLNEIVVAAAGLLEGRPYIGKTLEGDTEELVINVDGLDCVTFVENCFALAKATASGSSTWHDVARNLENLRYRDGVRKDFSSRLHYTTDWIADNIKRGNLREVTTSIPGYKTILKTLDFMTTHRDLYPAMGDEEIYRKCKENEHSLRSVQIPYVSRYDSDNPEVAEVLEDGDMISFVSNVDGLDSSHVALIRIIDGQPYMIHASTKKGKVVFETTPLYRYFKKSNRSAPGFRVVRLI
ncbi:MAG: DUF1460 domain-containing protein [Muribaculaceae bacterium]|nr:DUF1460 domain-containing protein [Muribaculaceae bacterium]